MKVGVIGSGYWGPNLIRNLVENKRVQGVIVCDLERPRLERIRQRYPIQGTTTDFQDILDDPGILAVVIATPLSTHFSLAKRALEAGKNVFVEKPFAQTSMQAQALIQLAHERNRVVMVGHTFEYSPAVVKIGEVIRSGELGNVYYITSSRVNLGIHQKDVSVLWDLAPHDLSMIFAWLDEYPVRVSAVGHDYVQPGLPDVAFIDIVFGSGIVAHVQVSWLAPSKLRNTTIVGSRKMIVYDDTDVLEKVKIFDKGVAYKDPETFGEYQLSYRAGDIVSPKIDSYEPLQAEMEDFLRAVQENTVPRTNGESGLRVVKVLEAAQQSLENRGEPVELVWTDAPAPRPTRVQV
jgi:predicted dehydrogenase